ncbi:MAG: aspartate ammonia-lyase [Sulfuricaulis sp.]|uniref:aspartate ammonia-lyase n=1 Tax=Sulfuricaulis sp. TaxID=2003553 RepID=UPI0025E1064D|nr:aspartate ammonia-lyase [Sulfuricaulis sp.]MCR4347600.1 aspartate ammonia-lyase [Sulfuricaulis sp.]
MSKKFRTEKDTLGDYPVPADAWYGIQTARAVENFPISGRRPDSDFIIAHVRIKRAAAAVNQSAGVLESRLAKAITKAADEIIAGQYHEEFVVDRFQAGAGTSHNMNSNEVIANLANVALGGKKGEYKPVHPNDHVNMGQSTNDTIPTAIRLAALAKLPRLLEAVIGMADAYKKIAQRESKTVKSGRTHLQDAVPTTVGREFAAYAWILKRSAGQIRATIPLLCQTGLGGSAAGTGLNTVPKYAASVAKELARLSGEPIRAADDLAAQMQSMHDLQQLSNAIRALALELTRIANDMRLLASGPRTGFAEIELPAVQPGSSIMPGKVNPVMFEMLNQVCYQVLGQDHAIALMTQAGQLELNVMMPALGSALFDAMDWLTHAVNATTEKSLRGLKVDRDRCRELAHTSVGLATLLNTSIGYSAAAEVAKESARSGRSVRDIVADKGLMSTADFDRLVERAAIDGNISPPRR